MALKIVALAGGVGGAKLANGLAKLLPAHQLSIIVNTADDFEHYGLHISPDLDTVCYTLAGLANLQTGWGRDGETWQAIENAKLLGGPGWFNLGDRDLGTHLERSRRLREGQPLSQVTKSFCAAWGIKHPVYPMSDQPVRTMVNTQDGELSFQDYFVRLRCEPVVKSFRFEGIEPALPAPGILDEIESADAIVICPSNPWVSIDPILAVAGLKSRIAAKNVVAVSPIIGGQTVKGPAAKMFGELGIQPSATAVAAHYADILNGFVIDSIDAPTASDIQALGIQTLTTDTLMKNLTDRRRLAQDVLHFVGRL